MCPHWTASTNNCRYKEANENIKIYLSNRVLDEREIQLALVFLALGICLSAILVDCMEILADNYFDAVSDIDRVSRYEGNKKQSSETIKNIQLGKIIDHCVNLTMHTGSYFMNLVVN